MKKVYLMASILFLLVVSCNNQNNHKKDQDKKGSNYKKSALIIVDMQNDFMEGGSLEVKDANSLIDKINQLTKMDWGIIVASKDWHPLNHVSFASNNEGTNVFDVISLKDSSKQVMWPNHCVQGTKGAEIHKDIDTTRINFFVLKGQNANVDSYSAFFDNNHLEKTDMDKILKENNIDSIYVVGLARDYCVRWTALDGNKLGYKTYFVFDASKPVDAKSDDAILNELKNNKIEIIYTKDLIAK